MLRYVWSALAFWVTCFCVTSAANTPLSFAEDAGDILDDLTQSYLGVNEMEKTLEETSLFTFGKADLGKEFLKQIEEQITAKITNRMQQVIVMFFRRCRKLKIDSLKACLFLRLTPNLMACFGAVLPVARQSTRIGEAVHRTHERCVLRGGERAQLLRHWRRGTGVRPEFWCQDSSQPTLHEIPPRYVWCVQSSTN